MTELNLRLEFTQDQDLKRVAKMLEKRIAQLPQVEEAEAAPERMKLTGAEVAAAIGVTIIVVRGSTELVREFRKFIAEFKGMVADLKNFKNIFIDVGEERITLDELTDEQILRLEEE